MCAVGDRVRDKGVLEPNPTEPLLGMLSKHGRAYDPAGLPPTKRLRNNLVDLYACNAVSAKRASELLADAEAAGVRSCSGLVSRKGALGNAARNLRRRLMQDSLWPKHYLAMVRCFDPKSVQEEWKGLHFLLPHEVLYSFVLHGDVDVINDRSAMDPLTLRHLQKCESEGDAAGRGLPMIGIGLWGDAAPCNWDRTESVQAYSWNLPGLGRAPWKGLRVPFTGLSTRHLGPNTHDDIMSIFAWSLQCLAVGLFPTRRHDSTPWQQGFDVVRQKRAASPLGLLGALVECRQDWKHLKECFKFPGWSQKSGICHLCSVTPEQLRDVGEEAAWRQPAHRLSHWAFVERQLQQGLPLSPLFSAPWVTTALFKYDWLHVVDQGVAADWLGQVFDFLLRSPGLLVGTTIKTRCETLWKHLDAWYKAQGVQDRLQGLTPTMVRHQKQFPKLRCSAAQARALIPFLTSATARWLNREPLEHEAIIVGCYHLHQCYMALSEGSIFFADSLRANSRKFALQVLALEAASPRSTRRWHVKPKLHAFLELCSDGSQPSLFWTYRDEDWGGSASRFSRRRGGLQNPRATSANMLLRFQLRTSMPQLK